MHNISDRDVKMFKRIYIYITPIIIIDDDRLEYIKNYRTLENRKLDVFRLIVNMRNTACHHILVKEVEIGNTIKGTYIEEFFINMVKLYQVFDLDFTDKLTDKLKDKFKLIKYLWDKIPDDKKIFKLCEKGKKRENTENANVNEKQIKDDEVKKIKEEKHKDFYNYFKELLHLLHGDGKGDGLFPKYGKKTKTKIKTIYRYAAPIIVWCKHVEKHFQKNHADDLLFKIIFYTRNSVCHINKYIMKEEDLKQIMQNMNIVYLAFGIDLIKERKEVSKILKDEPFTSKFPVSIREEIKVNNIEEGGNEIIKKIRKVLCNKDDSVNDEYFLFGNYLHYSVSTKIKSGDMITQVFQRNNNNIEWCDVDNRFILKDSEKNLNRKSIIKLASPVFVWIEIVNKLESTEYVEPFYLSINTLRQKIIDYLVNNQDNDDEENFILQEMKSIYDPIEQCFNTDETLHNYPVVFQYSDIFNKLVKHSVIGRKKRRFSYSFIFNYYYKQKTVTDEMKYTGKMFDIFNFCGLFYIFIKYFENGADTSFYKKVKEIIVPITDYIRQDTENTRENNQVLQNKIIEEIKLIFPDIFYRITNYIMLNIQKSEKISELQNKIIDEMKLVFAKSAYKITKYMKNKILNKANLDQQKELIDEIKSIFRKIIDRITDNMIPYLQITIEKLRDFPKEIIAGMESIIRDIANRITNDMMPKLNKTIEILSKLQDEIIDKIKYLLPDCDEFKSSEYKYVPEIFHTIYSYVVRSRPNVEMSFIDS